MSKDLYEVYKAVSQEGEVLYVGYGKRGRHTHCMSGISHNKELNRYYFMNSGRMVVEVIQENLSRDKAKQMEDYLIKSLQPKLNVVGVKKISNALHKKKFDTNYVGFEDLIACGNNYKDYFKSISMKSLKDIDETLRTDCNVAKLLNTNGDIQRLHSLIGDVGFIKSPFVICVDNKWVYNEASEDCFGVTPEFLKDCFVHWVVYVTKSTSRNGVRGYLIVGKI